MDNVLATQLLLNVLQDAVAIEHPTDRGVGHAPLGDRRETLWALNLDAPIKHGEHAICLFLGLTANRKTEQLLKLERQSEVLLA